MLKIPMSQARAPMVLARPVADPHKPESFLLKTGFQLDNEAVERLRSRDVVTAWVKYPSLDFLDEMIDRDIAQQQRDLYAALKNQLGKDENLAFAKHDYAKYVRLIRDISTRMSTIHRSSANFIIDLYDSAEDIFQHAALVASLALLLGLRLEPYLIRERPQLPTHLATDLTLLGLGCLLHDIGKLLLPEELRQFHMTAHNRGTPQWQTHTEVALEMMKGGLDPTAAQVVLNHHQHFDGSGFPKRKPLPGQTQPALTQSGLDIHLFCRIATVVDRFAGLRHLPDGSLAPTIVALKRMRNPGYVTWFDPVVYKAFMQLISAFAPGDQVTLSNGRQAVVVETSELEPCRPIVRAVDLDLAAPPNNTNTPEEADINLATQTNLHISRAGDFDVTPYLY